MHTADYSIQGLDDIITPALAIWPDIVDSNIEVTLGLAGGDANRWRPHIKTAKFGFVMRLLVAHGVVNFKCSTSLELLAACAAAHVMCWWLIRWWARMRGGCERSRRKIPACGSRCWRRIRRRPRLGTDRESACSSTSIRVWIEPGISQDRASEIVDLACGAGGIVPRVALLRRPHPRRRSGGGVSRIRASAGGGGGGSCGGLQGRRK